VTLAGLATLLALFLNAAALGVVAYQARLTRESVQHARLATELQTRTIQVGMLPNVHWLINVQVELEMWKKDLDMVAAEVTAAAANDDASELQRISRGGLRTPSGLVSRFGFEHAPEWVSTIWLAGAQYFYHAKGGQHVLWSEEKGARFDVVPDFARECRFSSSGIAQLLELFDGVVPWAYLNSPARINDDLFLD
jgi:hypothetical protein